MVIFVPLIVPVLTSRLPLKKASPLESILKFSEANTSLSKSITVPPPVKLLPSVVPDILADSIFPVLIIPPLI